MRMQRAPRGLGRDRLLAAAFVVLVSTAIVGFSAGDTGASFTGSTSNPGQSWNTATVQPPATQNAAASAVAGAVNLTWTASTSTPVGTQTLSYLVLRGPVGGPYTQVGTTATLASTDTPPADGTYEWVIQTKIAQGAGFFASGNSIVRSAKSDRTAPTMSITCNAAACTSGWYTAAVTALVSGNDGTGVGMGSVTRNVDSAGAVTTAGSSVSFSVSGDSSGHSVVYSGQDAVTNTAANATQTIKIDGTAPTVGVLSAARGAASAPVTVDFSWTAGSDALSGVAGYQLHWVQPATTCPTTANTTNFPGTVSLGAVTSYQLTGTAGKLYCAYLQTQDVAGNLSTASNIASAAAR
jgi:hypothetical protein